VRSLAEDAVLSRIRPEQIDEEMISEHLSTMGIADPDLIIRTAGEQRLSNFLLWQAAYSELYFCPKYWPDFDGGDLEAAVSAFSSRTRRFGALPDAAVKVC
jgi:undecaprenyl diphosphate synthase